MCIRDSLHGPAPGLDEPQGVGEGNGPGGHGGGKAADGVARGHKAAAALPRRRRQHRLRQEDTELDVLVGVDVYKRQGLYRIFELA